MKFFGLFLCVLGIPMFSVSQHCFIHPKANQVELLSRKMLGKEIPSPCITIAQPSGHLLLTEASNFPLLPTAEKLSAKDGVNNFVKVFGRKEIEHWLHPILNVAHQCRSPVTFVT